MKVPAGDAGGNEAQLHLGLAACDAGEMDRAAAGFRSLASRLHLTEVYNNLGVALARQGDRRALSYLAKSSQTDANDPDYHFNLAVELYRQGQAQEAASELRTLLALKPHLEAPTFLQATNSSRTPPANAPT